MTEVQSTYIRGSICNYSGLIMPFTPYHFGPGLFLGVLLFPFIDFSTVIIASMFIDIEPIAVLMFGLPYPLHGFFHSYVGATILSCVLTGLIYPFRKYLNALVSLFGLHQESSLRHIFPASIIGTYSHVFLDSFLYSEMNPLYPLIGNPFLGMLSSGIVYSLCVQLGLLGLGLYVIRLLYFHLKPTAERIEHETFIGE